jgi:hypothetical protein
MLQLGIAILGLERNLPLCFSSDDAVQGENHEQRECDSQPTGDPMSETSCSQLQEGLPGLPYTSPKNRLDLHTRLSRTPLFEAMTILPI